MLPSTADTESSPFLAASPKSVEIGRGPEVAWGVDLEIGKGYDKGP